MRTHVVMELNVWKLQLMQVFIDGWYCVSYVVWLIVQPFIMYQINSIWNVRPWKWCMWPLMSNILRYILFITTCYNTYSHLNSIFLNMHNVMLIILWISNIMTINHNIDTILYLWWNIIGQRKQWSRNIYPLHKFGGKSFNKVISWLI